METGNCTGVGSQPFVGLEEEMVDSAAGLQFYGWEPEDRSHGPFTVETIPVDEIDRVQDLLTVGGLNMCALIDHLSMVGGLTTEEQNERVETAVGEAETEVLEADRVGLMCYLARQSFLFFGQEMGEFQDGLFHEALRIAVMRGWLNDRVWDGQPDSSRGKLLVTLDSWRLPLTVMIEHGADPSLRDCEGKRGFDRPLPNGLPPGEYDIEEGEEEKVFIQHGDETRVVAWLASMEAADRKLEWYARALMHKRTDVVSWMESNGFSHSQEERAQLTLRECGALTVHELNAQQ